MSIKLYHEDWLMRQIDFIVQLIARFVLNKEKIGYKIENFDQQNSTDSLHLKLYDMIDKQEINAAENLLFESIDPDNLNDLMLALDFYQRLNELDDSTLDQSNFSREEIIEGIDEIKRLYNIDIDA